MLNLRRRPLCYHDCTASKGLRTRTPELMFSIKGLPPPLPSFALEPRPLRLTSDPTRDLPMGECHFILLHPSVQNQRCSCQSFHHNPSIPGSGCDCGHQACYHANTESTPPDKTAFNVAVEGASQALADRVRRLEDALRHERQIREDAILEERRAREREVRILREALHPFYRSGEELRRKLVELEDRLEGTYDEHLRLTERVVALDDANMALEKRIEEVEGSRVKRRRVNRQVVSQEVVQMVDSDVSQVSGPSSITGGLTSQASSISSHGPFSSTNDPEEPRSSGILNLIERPKPLAPVPSHRISSPQEEARSSGFLAPDLAERLAGKTNASLPRNDPRALASPVTRSPSTSQYRSQIPSGGIIFAKPRATSPQGNASVDITEIGSDDGWQNKRKREVALMPLDVLASVSAASPMA